MAVSLTLGIVKPDAVARGKAGKIVAHLRSRICPSGGPPGAADAAPGRRVLRGARGRPFYGDLVAS